MAPVPDFGYGGGRGAEEAWVAQRYFLGVKASVVRFYDARDSSSGFEAKKASGSGSSGNRQAGTAGGGLFRVESLKQGGGRDALFVGFEDGDLGQDGIGMVSLRAGADDLAGAGDPSDHLPVEGGVASDLRWHRS